MMKVSNVAREDEVLVVHVRTVGACGADEELLVEDGGRAASREGMGCTRGER